MVLLEVLCFLCSVQEFFVYYLSLNQKVINDGYICRMIKIKIMQFYFVLGGVEGIMCNLKIVCVGNNIGLNKIKEINIMFVFRNL